MADTKISALTAATSALATHELAVNEAGVSKKVTGAQLRTLVNTNPVLAAGDATHAPLTFTSGAVLTTPVAGVIEFDGVNLYGSLEAGNRGVIPVEYFIRANATVTYVSNTLQQALFQSPTNGALTLPVGVYEFEAFFSMGSMSATSGNGAFSLIGAGTATLTQVLQFVHGVDIALDTTSTLGGSGSASATQGAANATSGNVSTDVIVFVKGTFNVSVTGTIIPSFAQTTAAAAVLRVGSFFKCKRLGGQAVGSAGNWS